MSHKRKKPEGSPGVQLSLIITPMLDMSFQILAFFIMTYNPSALEGHIPGNLTPPDKIAQTGPQNDVSAEPPPSDDDLNPELNDAITVYIKAMAKDQAPKSRLEGTPSAYLVKTGLDTAMQTVADATVDPEEKWDEKALAKLSARLKEMGGKGSKANLKIAADGGLKQQYVMQVYDVAKMAGFSKIHFVPPPLNSKVNR